uniref:Uncharacterized protein n=1 Tax=Physcomitrium patens TaxID=3218 RepID=A0A2K1KLA9_PHYPA|nr:hypothetical protein PHYPA_008243 [Physcomitrium patens]
MNEKLHFELGLVYSTAVALKILFSCLSRCYSVATFSSVLWSGFSLVFFIFLDGVDARLKIDPVANSVSKRIVWIFFCCCKNNC